MHVVDTVHKTELDTDYNGLIDFMVKGRQVDLYLPKEKTDSDGYLTWDVEHWTSLDGRRFIRCYSLKGRVLRDSTSHNIYDMANDFHPEEAEKVCLS